MAETIIIRIETKRLILRNLKVEDVSEEYVNWLNDPEINPVTVLSGLNHPMGLAVSNNILFVTEKKYDPDTEETYHWALCKFHETAKLLWKLLNPNRHPNIVYVRHSQDFPVSWSRTQGSACL